MYVSLILQSLIQQKFTLFQINLYEYTIKSNIIMSIKKSIIKAS